MIVTDIAVDSFWDDFCDLADKAGVTGGCSIAILARGREAWDREYGVDIERHRIDHPVLASSARSRTFGVGGDGCVGWRAWCGTC
ncbi:hypothetical protein ACFQ9J_15995 [Streptomyces sp. NPDC056529]|uniref:hypothetical protein n=1 Tax=Streptomyces sp. NPDC056529 TaxID=3345855 RepID=UPI00368FA723